MTLKRINIEKANLYIIFLSFVWLVTPFGCIFFILLFINQVGLNQRQLKYLYLLISLSFAVLAFTQKSLYYESTDIERYYNEFYPFTSGDFNILSLLFSDSVLTYTFTFINVCLVIIFGNVQIISIFWIWIIYFLFFISLHKIMVNENIEMSKTNIFLFLTFSIFGAILFTQVTETIKNAAAFAIFFYILPEFIYGKNKLRIILIYLIGIGVHSSILMLFPIFFYRHFNTKILLLVLMGIMIACPFINIMEFSMSVLPDIGIFSEILNKAESYALDNASNSSIRYIAISLVILIITLFLRKEKLYNDENKYANIVIIYLIIMYLNYNASDAFIRFANFSHSIVVMSFVMFLNRKKQYAVPIVCLFVFFMVTNFQMTYGRTLSGGYCSSYMDNSIIKIISSNIYDYLTYKAYL